MHEKNDGKNKVIKVELSTWLINYSSDVSKGRVQRSAAIFVISGMKNPPKKLKLLQFLPRLQVLSLLFQRKSYLSKHLITLSRHIVRQRVLAELSRLVIRDSDKANPGKITTLLVCVFLSCGRNNMKSLQW